MKLTNIDSEYVDITTDQFDDFMELVSLQGIDRVQIWYPKAGHEWLQNSIEEWSSEEIMDENERELLEAWWEYFLGTVESYQTAQKDNV